MLSNWWQVLFDKFIPILPIQNIIAGYTQYLCLLCYKDHSSLPYDCINSINKLSTISEFYIQVKPKESKDYILLPAVYNYPLHSMAITNSIRSIICIVCSSCNIKCNYKDTYYLVRCNDCQFRIKFYKRNLNINSSNDYNHHLLNFLNSLILMSHYDSTI